MKNIITTPKEKVYVSINLFYFFFDMTNKYFGINALDLLPNLISNLIPKARTGTALMEKTMSKLNRTNQEQLIAEKKQSNINYDSGKQ